MQKPAKVDNFSFVIYSHTDVFNNHARLNKHVSFLLISIKVDTNLSQEQFSQELLGYKNTRVNDYTLM